MAPPSCCVEILGTERPSPAFYRPSTAAQRAHSTPSIRTGHVTVGIVAVGGQSGHAGLSSLFLPKVRSCTRPWTLSALAEVAQAESLSGLFLYPGPPCCATNSYLAPCLHALALFAASARSHWLTHLLLACLLQSPFWSAAAPAMPAAHKVAMRGMGRRRPENLHQRGMPETMRQSPAEPSSEMSQPTWMHVPRCDPWDSPKFLPCAIVFPGALQTAHCL